MVEIILIIVGILIIATLFDKWEKSKKENPNKTIKYSEEQVLNNSTLDSIETQNQKIKFKPILDKFKRIYGEKKFEKISNDISNSKQTKKLILQSVNEGIIPVGEDFITSIITNLNYSFSKGETFLVACFVLFELWIDSYGITHGYPSKSVLIQIENEIIQKTKSMSFKSNFEILDGINQTQEKTQNFDDKPFPYYGETFITDVMREVDLATGEEYTGQLTIGLFEFSEKFIKNNYDDEKGNIAYDKDDMPGFKKSWNYLGFDGNDYIFVDEDGVKWHVNDGFIKFRDEEQNVAYKFEINKNKRTSLSHKNTATDIKKDPFAPKNTVNTSIDKRTLKDPQNHIEFNLDSSKKIIESLRSPTLNKSSYFYDYGHLLNKYLVAPHKQKIVSNDYSAGSYNSMNDELGKLENSLPVYFSIQKEKIICAYVFYDFFSDESNDSFEADYLGLIDGHFTFHSNDNIGERLWFINQNLIRIISIEEIINSNVYLGDIPASDLVNIIYYIDEIK